MCLRPSRGCQGLAWIPLLQVSPGGAVGLIGIAGDTARDCPPRSCRACQQPPAGTQGFWAAAAHIDHILRRIIVPNESTHCAGDEFPQRSHVVLYIFPQRLVWLD